MSFEVVSDIPPVPDDNIVKLTDFISRARWKAKQCRHSHMEIDEANRRITCKDCNREVEAFEAVLIWSDVTSDYHRMYEKMKKDHKNLADYVPHLRQVRELESMWRGNMLPMCPHCAKGVTPSGLLSRGSVHKAFAEAMLKAEAEQKQNAAVNSEETKP